MNNVDQLRIMELVEIPGFMVKRLDGPIRIECSAEACELFRGWVEANKNPWAQAYCPEVHVPMSFTIEQCPYRSNGKNLVLPHIEVLKGEDWAWVQNPEWATAPYELVIGYGVGGMQIVTYKRNLQT